MTREGSALIVQFSAQWKPYIDAIKAIRGYRYDPVTHRWSVHIGQIRDLRAAAARHRWVMSDAVKAIPDLAAADLPMLVTAEGEQLVIDGPFREDVWKLLSEAKAHLNPQTGTWLIPFEQAVEVVLDLRRIGKVKFIGAHTEIIERIERAERMLALSRALTPSPGWELTPWFKRELRPFQHPGVEYMVAARRCFNWGTMGAGKTSMALAALEQQAWMDQADSPYPTLIIPPAGLKTSWLREIATCLPHRTVHICEGKTPLLPLHEPDIWICNYDVLGLTDIEGRPRQRTWATQFIDLIRRGRIRSYVIDEGHRANNRKAQRTVAILEASKVLAPTGTRYLLTGTPVRNRRAEIDPQLAAIGREGEFGDVPAIKADKRLSRRMRTVCAWRPDPTEVLRSLGVLKADGTADPVVQRVIIDGDPKVLTEYRRAEANFLDYLRDAARAKAIELGQDPESAAVQAALKAGSAAQLMLIGTLCRLAGQAKIRAAREWVADFEATGAKLLVFAENHDMMDAIADGRIPQIRGGIKHTARTALCDRFQDEAWIPPAERLQTLVLQIVAAGEGLTLTKAYDVMFAQLSWTPGAHDQAAARAAWRMNDPHNVLCHYLVCAGTIDEDRMDILDAKRAEMAVVTDGDLREQLATTSSYGDVFAKLLNRALGLDKPTP